MDTPRSSELVGVFGPVPSAFLEIKLCRAIAPARRARRGARAWRFAPDARAAGDVVGAL
jgi:hypothetical protein